MANYRRDRINDETQKALSLIVREIKDPRVASAFVSITGAEVSGDLKYAKIYYSILGADGDKEKEKEVARGLKSGSGFIRRRLAQELDLRQTPELTFCPDHSMANGAHISSLLHSLQKQEKPLDTPDDGEKDDGN
ncbi:MAG: 30S ribosome-binding factor RbfA [Clostridia bacterium]|nr:30S ribosome-binding factor RbfA [Clostridia bacterium]